MIKTGISSCHTVCSQGRVPVLVCPPVCPCCNSSGFSPRPSLKTAATGSTTPVTLSAAETATEERRTVGRKSIAVASYCPKSLSENNVKLGGGCYTFIKSKGSSECHDTERVPLVEAAMLPSNHVPLLSV